MPRGGGVQPRTEDRRHVRAWEGGAALDTRRIDYRGCGRAVCSLPGAKQEQGEGSEREEREEKLGRPIYG